MRCSIKLKVSAHKIFIRPCGFNFISFKAVTAFSSIFIFYTPYLRNTVCFSSCLRHQHPATTKSNLTLAVNFISFKAVAACGSVLFIFTAELCSCVILFVPHPASGSNTKPPQNPISPLPPILYHSKLLLPAVRYLFIFFTPCLRNTVCFSSRPPASTAKIKNLVAQRRPRRSRRRRRAHPATTISNLYSQHLR